MKYLVTTFQTTPCDETTKDILAAQLGTIGYDSFEITDTGLEGYILAKEYKESSVEKLLNDFPMPNCHFTFVTKEMEDVDWNKEWEKNYFQPLIIGDACVIHSTFHKNIPTTTTYDITINPQMAFGTGHHQTTFLMLSELLKADLKDKTVLDMGCGTSILAILASMRGAKTITAIDIDDWCIQNSKDNFKLNHIDNITVKEGDASLLAQEGPFDVVIANINRNILLRDLPIYRERMKKDAVLYISGFYTEDVPLLQEKIEALGLELSYFKEKERWTVMKCVVSSTTDNC
ncbi:MAG: 50S ribosomal protein L11 methyltransferase [Bacteroidaceae bacterium]